MTMYYWKRSFVMMYLAINRADHNIAYGFSSREEATRTCIQLNQADEEHPSYDLYECGEHRAAAKVVTYIGRLWRAFGRDFDPADCWRKI